MTWLHPLSHNSLSRANPITLLPLQSVVCLISTVMSIYWSGSLDLLKIKTTVHHYFTTRLIISSLPAASRSGWIRSSAPSRSSGPGTSTSTTPPTRSTSTVWTPCHMVGYTDRPCMRACCLPILPKFTQHHFSSHPVYISLIHFHNHSLNLFHHPFFPVSVAYFFIRLFQPRHKEHFFLIAFI